MIFLQYFGFIEICFGHKIAKIAFIIVRYCEKLRQYALFEIYFRTKYFERKELERNTQGLTVNEMILSKSMTGAMWKSNTKY